jgi:hypothetical protein
MGGSPARKKLDVLNIFYQYLYYPNYQPPATVRLDIDFLNMSTEYEQVQGN